MILNGIGRLLRWVVRKLGGLTMIRFGVLFMALWSVGAGLAALTQNTDASATGALVFLGLLTGWHLARRKLKGWQATLIGMLIGFLVLALTVGRLGGALVELISAAFAWLVAAFRSEGIDSPALAEAWAGVGTVLSLLAARLAAWLRLTSQDVLIYDPMAASMVWGLFVWVLSLWAAWMTRRRQAVLLGLLPAAILLALNVYYTNSKAGLPWLLLLGACLIMSQAVQQYTLARQRWQAARLDRADVEPSLAITVGSLAVALIIAGALMPSFSIAKMRETFNDVFRGGDDTLAESLGLQQTPMPGPGTAPGGEGRPTGASGVSEFHVIRGGPQLTQEIVMLVRVEGYEPIPLSVRIQAGIEDPVRYYWRAQTYDLYTGSGWTASSARPREYAADQPLYPDLELPPGEVLLVTQHVERLATMDEALFTAGGLLQADQPYFVSWRTEDDLVYAQVTTETYTAISALPQVTIAQMRQAGTEYPQEISERYLRLPDNLPNRVRDIAIDLTLDKQNPYDRLEAIERYLRQFPYTLDVPQPPLSRDAVDFFLYDLQTGYCDYYATSMAVLGRAVGIPTRIVTGYSTGGYDEITEQFVVRNLNAHTWVEAYFPGIGWVEFEPTASQTRITRPAGDLPVSDRLGGSDTSPPPIPARRWFRWQWVAWPLALIGSALVIFLLAWLLPLDALLLRLRPAGPAVTAIYRRLYRLGHRWDLPGAGSLTPHQFAAALAGSLAPLRERKGLAVEVDGILADLESLTDLYTRMLYADQTPGLEELRQASGAWTRIKRRLWWVRLRTWRRRSSPRGAPLPESTR